MATEIDDSLYRYSKSLQLLDVLLYSRQRYVLGDTAMHKMAASNVFISGMGGLGVEIGRYYIMHLIWNSTIVFIQLCVLVSFLTLLYFMFCLAKNVILAGVKV